MPSGESQTPLPYETPQACLEDTVQDLLGKLASAAGIGLPVATRILESGIARLLEDSTPRTLENQ